MKNKKTWLVILAITLVFGMIAVGCEDDTTGDDPNYEDLSAAERWFTRPYQSTTATISLSVDADDVAAITVGGTAEPENGDGWKVMALYNYNGKKNTRYAYVFEAWTAPGAGERTVSVLYYEDGSTETYSYTSIKMDETRKTYTVMGQALPKAFNTLQFHCANQLGTFYVKIISITDTESGQLSYELSDDEEGYIVSAGTVTAGNVVIPATYNGKPVIGIASGRDENYNPSSFAGTEITSIEIPASVKYIYNNAFSQCYNLKNVTFAANSQLEFLGNFAFSVCRGITSIEIPASVIAEGWVFNWWENTQTITINGKADRAATIDAGWDENWDVNCEAKIIYKP